MIKKHCITLLGKCSFHSKYLKFKHNYHQCLGLIPIKLHSPIKKSKVKYDDVICDVINLHIRQINLILNQF